MAPRWARDITLSSFRGVALPAADALSKEQAQRLAIHEYPGLPAGWTEHMDRSIAVYSVTCVVSGDRYVSQRDALEDVLDDPEPGTLVHPTRGSLSVSVQRYSVEESSDRLGGAVFRIDFVESGRPDMRISAKPSRGLSVLTAADDALSAVGGAFADIFDLDAVPQWLSSDSISRIAEQLDDIRSTIQGPLGQMIDNAAAVVSSISAVEDAVTALVNLPAELATEVQAIYALVRDLAAYQILTGTAGIADPATGGTPSDDLNAANLTALDRLFLRSALATHAYALEATTFYSADEAEAAADLLSDRIGLELDYMTGDEIDAFIALRAAVSAYAIDIALRLPRLLSVRLTQPTSSFELAQRYHGDADRADEIRDRNDIVHPGMATGAVLVLTS